MISMAKQNKTIAVAGSAFTEDVRTALAEEFDLILLPPDPRLPDAVSGHADLSVVILGDELLVREDYYNMTAREEIDRILMSAGLRFSTVSKIAGKSYPLDCGLCAKAVYVAPAFTGPGGKPGSSADEAAEKRRIVIFASKTATYPEVTGAAPEYSSSSKERLLHSHEGCLPEVIFVNQGYCACAAAACADGALITADRGIASAAFRAGIPCLTIRPGHIMLPGYGDGDGGFIGGASGLCGDRLYFSGDPHSHPDGEAICDFCREHGTEVVPLTGGKLFDGGGIVFP